jgi:hypothetical protein
MQDWLAPHTLLPLFGMLAAAAGAWFTLRAQVVELRKDIDLLMGERNGGPSVTRRLGELARRLDIRDDVAEKGLQRLARCESKIEGLQERQEEILRRLEGLAPRARGTR